MKEFLFHANCSANVSPIEPTVRNSQRVNVWIARLLVTLVAITLTLGAPTNTLAVTFERAWAAADLESEIKSLIQQLDAQTFQQRELATQRLAEIGQPALRPLAAHVLEGSPESVWRTKKILQSIGTRGDESVFYQAMGILQVLYFNRSKTPLQRFERLESQWRTVQKDKIVERLTQLGALVSEGEARNVAQNVVPMIIFNGQTVGEYRPADADENETVSAEPKQTKPRSEMNAENLLEQIDQILSSSARENRKRVVGAGSQTADPATQRQASLEMKQQLEMQLRMRAMMAGRQALVEEGVAITLGEKWAGTSDDLNLLSHLNALSEIELVDFPSEQFDSILGLEQLSSLKITGESISDAALSGLAEKKLGNLEIANRTISKKLMSDISKIETLSMIVFSNCEFSPAALETLSAAKHLRSLVLEDMQLDDQHFESLKKLESVRLIQLELCKFNTQAYQSLEKTNRVRMTFTPQAFLGVRGGQGVDDREISQVVPDSGAEKGGLKMGDIVTSINGQPIKRFEDIRLHIAQHKVGQELVVEVQRDDEPVKLTIELGRFDRDLR